MNAPVSVILDHKGSTVHQTRPDATVREAVNQMNDRHIGALLVTRDGKPVGMFTERDILVRVVSPGRNPETTRVEEVMSAKLVTIAPETTIEDAMLVVTNRRCRHLPMVDAEGKLLGMVSIGDLTRWLVRDRESYIENLNTYIWGTPSI